MNRVAQLQQAAILRERPRDLLEVGCFEGSDISLWILRCAGLRSYTGVDLSGRVIESFWRKLDPSKYCRVTLQHKDFLDADYAPESFDIMYMNGVLHLPGLKDSRRYAGRVTRGPVDGILRSAMVGAPPIARPGSTRVVGARVACADP